MNAALMEAKTDIGVQAAIKILAPHRHDYRLLPLYGALCQYREHGGYVGSFLFALLSGDFREAMERADHGNLWLIPIYATFLYNEMPANIHGSPERVNAWLAAKREVAS